MPVRITLCEEKNPNIIHYVTFLKTLLLCNAFVLAIFKFFFSSGQQVLESMIGSAGSGMPEYH